MVTVNREAIETFMSITGASEPIATLRLQEHGGNLNEAVNAHFSEGDRNIVQEASGAAPPNDLMDIDDPPVMEPRDPTSLLSATKDMNPFSILDPAFRSSLLNARNLFDASSDPIRRGPFVSQPREVREIPIEVKDGDDNLAASSGHGPRIEDVTDSTDAEGPQMRGTVTIEDEDDDYIPGNLGVRGNDFRPSAPQLDDITVYANDIEEEMIRAAIEASKRDAELQNNQALHDVNVQQQGPPQHNIDDIEQAVSLSLKTAEQEQLKRETNLQVGASGSVANNPAVVEESGNLDEPIIRQIIGASGESSSIHLDKEGSSFAQDEIDELDEQPLVRNSSRHRSSASERFHSEVEGSEIDPATDSLPSTVSSQMPLNGNAFPSEWGGISSEEHDEAVMLEAAMFGGVPEGGYHVPYAPHQVMHPGFDTAWRNHRPPSPGLVAQRAIREQQDDEYLAALQADREKELKGLEDEKAAREIAMEEQRKKEEEAQELERQVAAKEASLPEEPSVDVENAVTLLVRMPDGSRRGRRFLKSDKLQSLFDFIDVGKAVKPGTYRLVRPYPRQAFSSGEGNLSLDELGLTSKQEALFLELI